MQVSRKEIINHRIPRHIAIIMDGNGRWAKERLLPRTAGHQAGVSAVRKTVEYCVQKGVKVLTLFAFSSENWRRPQQEVSILMDLFIATLEHETEKLHQNDVRLRVIGDRNALAKPLQDKIATSELLTRNNRKLELVIATNYGGRWDILQGVREVASRVKENILSITDINERMFGSLLSLPDLPEPDLFIRTGGEQRISNFLLWQLAYTELYFTSTLWPDFDEPSLELALQAYAGRQRRFGHTSEQVESRVNKSLP
jgi:undecaprenyl diphosphate synthase